MTAFLPVVDAALEVTPTVISPLPVPPVAESETHGMSAAAFHWQLLPLVAIRSVPLPAAGPTGVPSDDVSMVTLHASGSWLMTNGCPPMVSVPERGAVVELAATE